MQPEPYGAASAASDEDSWSWLVTFSDLVLQLFGFAMIAALAGATVRGPAPAVADAPAVAVAQTQTHARAQASSADQTIALDDTAAAEPQAAPAISADADVIPVARVREDLVPAAPVRAVDPERTTVTASSVPGSSQEPRMAALGTYVAHLASLQPELAASVTSGAREVVVKIGDLAGFAPGSAVPTPALQPLLLELRTLIAASPDLEVQVSGHTDDVPIRTAQFPSNLELSLARASRVAHELAGADPTLSTRISAAGFGEQRPVASNGDAQGRARNRRVEIRLASAGM